MKHLYLVILLLSLCSLDLFAQSDSSGWIYKDGFREQKLKVGAITFIRYSKDGKYIYTNGYDATLRKWNAKTGQLVNKYVFDKDSYSYYDLSADETKVFYYHKDKGLTLLSLKDSSTIKLASNYKYKTESNCMGTKSGGSVSFDPLSNQVIQMSYYDIDCRDEHETINEKHKEGQFELYSTDNGDYMYSLQNGSEKANLTFSPNGSFCAYNTYKWMAINDKYGYRMGEMYSTVLADHSFKPTKVLEECTESCTYAHGDDFDYHKFYFSPDSRMLAHYSFGTLSIVSVPDGSLIKKWDNADELFGDICTIGFTNDGKKLIIASDNSSSISFWSISTGEFIYAKYFSSAYDWKFAFSKDSIQLTTGSSDGIIRVFDNSLHQELKASFTCDSFTVCLGDTVKFHDSSPGRPTKWFWDFGDSSTSTLKDPVHVYPDLGFYSIKFIASNNKKSDTLFIKSLIRIKPRPTGMPDDQENSRIDFSVRPNPLDDNSVIHFYLDKPQPVQVKIFNQLGQEVAQIADGYFSAGSNTISFNPNDYRLISGLYYVRLTAGSDFSVKEILWQK